MLRPLLGSPRLGLFAKTAAVLKLLMPPLISLVALGLTSGLLALGFMATHSGWSHDTLFILLLFVNAGGFCGLMLYAMMPFFRFSLQWSVLGSLIHLPLMRSGNSPPYCMAVRRNGPGRHALLRPRRSPARGLFP